MTVKHATQIHMSSLKKIIVHAGLGRMRNNLQFEEKILPEVMEELKIITGQKPVVCRAKKAIANFKTRAGDVLGAQVTLRRKRMRDFFIRIVSFVLPRVKDFRGVPISSVDGDGNLNIGFREQYVFPEIEIEKSKVNFGLQVTVNTSIRDRNNAIELFKSLGIPFKEEKKGK